MRMRQSLAQLEREFEHEAVLERTRREELRRTAVRRTRVAPERADREAPETALPAAPGLDRPDGRGRHLWPMFRDLAWLMG